MPLKLTSLLIDAMTKASESPVPVPLERAVSSGIPLAPNSFPHDWSIQVRLETRWQTDVTRPYTGSRPEKWALTTRPSRRLTARMVGFGKAEANALLQSVLTYTSVFGVPVPLYCDATPVQAVNGTRIDGDFTRRRFFLGGRIVFYPLRPVPDKGTQGTVFATITELNPRSIVVQFDPSTTRTVTTNDMVAPCMDVELTQSAGSTALTDEVLEVEASWEELDGACSLPASWPPTDATNPEILSPFCQIVDNYPVFPFDPNWAEGVDVEVSRDIDSTGSGRSTIQEPKGDPFLRFSMSIMGWNRDRAWNVIRFFDSMQGRAGDFYLVHPLSPFRLDSIPSTSTARIASDGDLEAVKRHYKRLAFFRADGTFVSRKASSYSASAGIFQISLDSPLPDTNFVDVQPLFICSFDHDNLEESWSTSEVVPGFDLSIREEPDPGPVNVPGISYTPGSPAFLAIPGCNLLLRAGSGCVDDQGQQSLMWPGRGSLVQRWRDMSAGPHRTSSPPPVEKYLERVATPKTARLIRFPLQWQNNGQAAMFDPRFDLAFQTDQSIPIESRHLWSSGGWTLFLCFTPEPLYSLNQRTLVEIRNNSYHFFFHLDSGLGLGADRSAFRVQNSGSGANTYIHLSSPITGLSYSVIVCLRVEGGTARVWVNGNRASSVDGGSFFPLGVPTQYTMSRWFEAFDRSHSISTARISSRFGQYGCANLVASYNRPLDIDEINKIHDMIGDMYRTAITPSTLY